MSTPAMADHNLALVGLSRHRVAQLIAVLQEGLEEHDRLLQGQAASHPRWVGWFAQPTPS
jgi:hypothetical protein